MGQLGILVFSSPVQHRAPGVAAGLAEAAVALGHAATVFCLGDGVLLSSRSIAQNDSEGPGARLARLSKGVELVNCSTCAKFRGLGDLDLIPNARNGTLEDLVELLDRSDRFVALDRED